MGMFKIFKNMIFILSLSVFIIACGGGGGSGNPSFASTKAIFIDDVVEGIYYESYIASGYTNSNGEFPFYGGKVSFYVGKIKIGEISSLPSDNYIFIQDLLGLDRNNVTDESVLNIGVFLQSLDSDISTDKIEIKREDFNKFNQYSGELSSIDAETLLQVVGISPKSETEVQQHLSDSFSKYNVETFTQAEKDFLYQQLHTNYLWADYVESKSYDDFIEPNQMIDAFKYATLDKWSYAETFSDYTQSSQQQSSGFGCYFLGSPVIAFYDFESPCEKAGLKRGDILLLIDGESISNQSYNDAKSSGNTFTFTILRGDEYLDIDITSEAYTYKASKTMLIENDDKNIGYYIYNGFTSASYEEIESAFTSYKNVGIDELIIDLRYNGGGSVAMASILLDKIGGYNNEDELQFYLQDVNLSKENTYFSKDDNSINLQRVFFLTSQYTASASELVINALKPYLDVKVIGSQTHGKPVGMTGRYISDNYIYWLINFSVHNANGVSGYYDGLSVDCNVTDSVTYERGDSINEPLLKEAISYIENDSCISSGSSRLNSREFSKPFINNFKMRN